MRVGDQIIAGSERWTLTCANDSGVIFEGGDVSLCVTNLGVSCAYAGYRGSQPYSAPIEVVEAAIRIWKELNA